MRERPPIPPQVCWRNLRRMRIVHLTGRIRDRREECHIDHAMRVRSARYTFPHAVVVIHRASVLNERLYEGTCSSIAVSDKSAFLARPAEIRGVGDREYRNAVELVVEGLVVVNRERRLRAPERDEIRECRKGHDYRIN